MFVHQAGPQALVQYSHLCDCIRAKGELEKATFVLGRRRYSFEVQYSKLRELVIHKNNNYSRDFRLYPLDVLELQGDKASLGTSAGTSDDCLRRGFSQSSAEEAELRSSGSEATLESDSLLGSGSSSPRGQETPLPGSLRSGLRLLGRLAAEELGAHSLSPYEESEASGLSPHTPRGASLGGRRNLARDGCVGLELWGGEALCRRDSELSSMSGCSLRSDRTDSMGLGEESPDFGLAEPRGISLFPSESIAVRKYVLEGFSRTVPISDLVDLLYGIDIKYAEYRTEPNGYAVVIFGRSEWSDAMLISYLRSNPVDGRIIQLRGSSEVVS